MLKVDKDEVIGHYYLENPTGHWFDKGTMSFFKSKVSNFYQHTHDNGDEDWGYYFISSETGPDCLRTYTIRYLTSSGDIGRIGEFMQYKTLDSAKRAMIKMMKNNTINTHTCK